MDNFEFLRSVNIGQYLPLDSFLHRLDPRARILAFSAVLIAATFCTHPLGLIAALLLVLLGLALGQIPLRFALRGLLTPLPFLVFLAILQVFLTGHPAEVLPVFSAGFIKVYAAGLVAASMLLLRFCVLILLLSLFSFTLSSSEMIHGLESLFSPLQKLGIPTHDLIMVLQVTMRFIPFLAQAAERIAKAQASRGAEWGTRKGGLLQRARQVVPLIVPLFLTSLRRAESMALAMDARGYGSSKLRTSMFVMHFTWKDAWFVLITVLLAVAILLSGLW